MALDARNSPMFGTIVHVATGVVTRCGRPVELTRRERTVAAALAVHQRPASSETLAPLLFPDRDDTDAARLVKVYVYRVRQRVAPDFIVRTGGGYGIGPHVTVDLHHGRAVYDRLLRGEAPADDAEHDEILELARGLRAETTDATADTEWWEAAARRAARLGRDLAMALGHNALARGDFRRACAIALELTYEDASDESAWELLIRAKLAQGDHREAIRNFRCYEHALATELSATPSAYLRELVETPPNATCTTTTRAAGHSPR
jgi:DNA-binding SARP family transcriptional activator